MKETIEFIYFGWENVVITFALIAWVGFWVAIIFSVKGQRGRHE